jgi:NADH-quinone oxidoreductase subunit G
VRIKGRPGLHPSCNLPAVQGMEIENECPEVNDARQGVMQFFTLNHPPDCPVCDKAGECKLQRYHVKYNGLPSLSIEPKKRKPKVYDLNARILLDAERCLLCSRCVRFTREISGSGLLGIVERGHHSRVERLEQNSPEDHYSDNMIESCPGGALLSRDFLYKSRVWYLEKVASVCPGCARGCSINLWRRKKEWQLRALGAEKNRMVYRVTPLENKEINGPWICNKGFDAHKLPSRERSLVPRIAGVDATQEEALSAASQLLSEAKSPAVLVSAWASNEELAVFKATLAPRVKVYARQDAQPEAGELLEDKLLIRADKNPNSFGVAELFGATPFSAAAGHDVVLVWGDHADYDSLGGAKVIHLATLAVASERPAEVLIPISNMFERSGSYKNFEGKVNRFEQVFDKPALVLHASDVFGRL